MSKNFPKSNGPFSNKNVKNPFPRGNLKNLNISDVNEPLIQTTTSRRKVEQDFESTNQAQDSLCINLAVENEGLTQNKQKSADFDNQKASLPPSLSKGQESAYQNPSLPNQACPRKVKIEDQEEKENIDENKSQMSKFEPNMSSSSLTHSITSKTNSRFNKRIDELKRQQAKLDKIKSEKDQLEAFLNYQKEMEEEKERKKQEEIVKMEKFYVEKAIVVQKYTRVWLAKRYVEGLKEQEFQRQKLMLNQALDEMRDQVRVVGTDSKERFISAAVTIQKYARGMFIRKLLAPYFSLYRKVNPMVKAIEMAKKRLSFRAALYSLY